MENNLAEIDTLAHAGEYLPHDLVLAPVDLERNTTVNGWCPLEANLEFR